MSEEEPLTPEQMTPAARNAVATVCALVGGGIVAFAAGIIPLDESAFHAPHWVIGACGFVFMIAGFMVVVPESMPRMKNFLAAVMLSMFAAIPGWIAFGSGPRVFGGSVSVGAITSATHPGEMFGRIVFGFGAVLLGLCAAYVWWKWLRSLFGPVNEEGNERAN